MDSSSNWGHKTLHGWFTNLWKGSLFSQPVKIFYFILFWNLFYFSNVDPKLNPKKITSCKNSKVKWESRTTSSSVSFNTKFNDFKLLKIWEKGRKKRKKENQFFYTLITHLKLD